jgi:hypothetical protein
MPLIIEAVGWAGTLCIRDARVCSLFSAWTHNREPLRD